MRTDAGKAAGGDGKGVRADSNQFSSGECRNAGKLARESAISRRKGIYCPVPAGRLKNRIALENRDGVIIMARTKAPAPAPDVGIQ